MSRWVAATVAAFAVSACFALPVAAQIHGVPASVTSTGFGGHFNRFPGTPASVTSLGPHGFNDRSHLFVGSAPPGVPGRFPRRPRSGRFFPAPGYYYAGPYLVDPGFYYGADYNNAPADDSGDAADYPNYPAGPTIFDRRASGASSQSVDATYSRREMETPRPPAPRSEESSDQAENAPDQDQPETVLIYKDGRQLEVQNYAIVGSMLYDLTSGRRTKIALSDLNLTATAKENDERGVDFQLPATPGSN